MNCKLADGKVVIETGLDSSGIEKGLKSLESITVKGLKAVTATIAGTSTALAGMATAAIKVGSDFEAQMSRVQAISGATGEEFDQLREQAIQLGSDTAFSASQAAEGMENLAAAGFTTNEIMSAMPGMLDLAAASGEDLAASADIAASTLRGFGLEAEEAGHVADVLAENANRTNSSVAETGEAMKYIAPLARAAGISMEETAAAIGIMANAGIQGSQAGTTLRGALSRLSKPTNVMQQAMDELGVSFYDSEGKMLSLADQVGMLKSAMEGMTDEQKNNYLVTLYGQEALSGMLALINEGPGSLSSLTSAYEACDGAAQTAAATMQDNLKGAVEQLGGSAETLGIVFYDSVAESLKNAAQVATESINNITDAFNAGGLNSAIQAAGDEFANLATIAASHAPDMVNTAVAFIQSFAQGIISNRDQLINAAGEAAKALASGLASLLPSELRAPVESAIDAISESLSSGGLKTAGKTAVNTLENVIEVVGKLADVALPPLMDILDFTAENLDIVAATATAAFTAIKGYKVITSASKAAKTLAATTKLLSAAEKANALQVLAASGALTAKEMIVGVLTGKITLATAAQTAWNAVMAANPIGLVITAVGALAAALGIYSLTTDDASDSTDGLTEKQRENIEASKEAIKNIEEEAAARQKMINSSTAEIDNAEALWSELQKCVDANGKVKAGYEARAQYITGELSNALGTEITLTDGVIDNYSELETSIYDVIAAKKAEAVINAMQDEYANAMQEQAEKAEALAVAYENLNSLKERQAELEAEAQELEGSSNYGDARRYAEITEELSELNGELEEQQTAFNEVNTAMQDNQKVISDYDKLTEAVMSGSTETINSALAEIQSGLDATLEAGSEAALGQAQTAGDTLLSILSVQEQGLANIEQSVIDSTAESMGIAVNTISTSSENMKKFLESVGSDGAQRLLTAMQEADLAGNLSVEAQSGMQAMIDAMNSMDDVMQETGLDSGWRYVTGVSGQTDEALNAGKSLAENADSGASSITGYDAGDGFGAGFVEGVNSWGVRGAAAGAGLAALALAAAKEEINSNSPAKETIKLGKYFGQGFEIGITDEEKAVGKASKKLADTALRSLDMSAVSNRMRETLSFNTGRIASSFALESSSTILKRQQVENAMKFSDSDIRKLADEFGIVAGQEFSERMEGMTFRAYDRDFARLVKEVQQP